MRKYILSVLSIVLVGVCGTSCSDLFEPDSTAVVFDEGQRLDSPNDSLYSVMGILSQLQGLGERYVLLGELRGDLMTATSSADVSLQDLSANRTDAGNIYADATDYFAVINNCNYALERMDTTVAIYQSRVLVPEYVAIKVIRDWTLFQTALAYGETPWMDKPVLTIDDATKSYASVSIDEVAQRVIDDLTPHLAVRPLDYGTIDGYSSSRFFYPIEVLVADMHLFLGHYEAAAQHYCHYLKNNRLTLTKSYANSWARDTRQQAYINHTYSYIDEMLCGILYSSDIRTSRPSLVRYTYNETPAIVPSASYLDLMEHATFFYAEEGALTVGNYFEGDLRGQAQAVGGRIQTSAYGNTQLGASTQPRIMKYLLGASLYESASDPENTAVKGLYATRMLPVLRTPHVYLRLAEALNRMGKPSTAFAILKYGLNRDVLENSERVLPEELEGTESWLDFTWTLSTDGSGNVGTAYRGRGRGIALDTQMFVLPETTEKLEDMILDEMAAETAFEGNRFFDLLRVARHRGENGNNCFIKRNK